METTYKLPPIVWLRITDYMCAWLQYELGGDLRIGTQRVICVQHLPGAREVLRMPSETDTSDSKTVGNSISAARKNCIDAGLRLDPESIERQYGVTEVALKTFVPVECPTMRVNFNGVLRPWTLNVNFGKPQSGAMLKLLRDAFWMAVGRFAENYAKDRGCEKYAQIDMIEAFCAETNTPDEYAEAMRREWQRRMKRQE